MKPTETYEQLLKRFNKRKGCIDTVEYLLTGKLPNDGNHDGMKPHKPQT